MTHLGREKETVGKHKAEPEPNQTMGYFAAWLLGTLVLMTWIWMGWELWTG